MRDELKTALDKVTADDALKQSTRAFLARQTGDFGAAKARPRTARRAVYRSRNSAYAASAISPTSAVGRTFFCQP